MQDLLDAAEVLRRNNVPPFLCTVCGSTWYVRAPAGWAPGDPVVLECSCGTLWKFPRGVRCGGEMLGQGPAT